MHAGIISARDTVSDNAPKIVTIKIDKDHIRTLIGPSGKLLRDNCCFKSQNRYSR